MYRRHSANSLGFDVFKLFSRSFIYHRNRMGPRLEPCGTPHLIFFAADILPFIRIFRTLVKNFVAEHRGGGVLLTGGGSQSELICILFYEKMLRSCP